MAFFPFRIFATILLAAAPCAAQKPGSRSTRSFSGVVKDALGRPIAGSGVTLKSRDGKIGGVTTTDDRVRANRRALQLLSADTAAEPKNL
jgi:hypothetical protein